MTGSDRYVRGIILNVSGALLLCGGLALSATLVGACVGIPMALVGLPLLVVGCVWTWQGYMQKQQEAVAAGVKEGMAAARAAESEERLLAAGDTSLESPPILAEAPVESAEPGAVGINDVDEDSGLPS